MNTVKTKNISLWIAVLALAVAIAGFSFAKRHHHKVGYVLIREVFNEFDLKKEMEKKYNASLSVRKKIADSLQVDLSVLAGRIRNGNATNSDKDLFERKRAELDHKIKVFDQDNAFMSKQFDEQIITQLNQYVSDFGKEFGYDLIYGNTADGSIMYGTDELNVTKQVIEFVNMKYKGVK